VAAWRSDNVVGRINEVILRRVSPSVHVEFDIVGSTSAVTGHFAYCLDSSPTDITHLILFYSGSLVGKMNSNL